MSVVLNTTVPSSVLKKKHCSISYHRVREAIAAKILQFAHITSSENLNDVMTKTIVRTSLSQPDTEDSVQEIHFTGGSNKQGI